MDGVVDARTRGGAASRPLELAPEALEALERVRTVLCEPTRTGIMLVLARHEETVTQLARVLGQTKWSTSRHLRVLRENGLVTARQSGRNSFYRLAEGPQVKRITRILNLAVRAE